ncbi:DUF4279 domain-containing protein [Xanthomonas sp. LMG 8992]|uniref:DUF4279 domain-containing protein n=1 Tax=Xanthomonas sp. LMG 8992 TaxID=1591157 RepID=UPI00136AE172|nr:DUF4279 domain-containing protein [Xanthomonas sp. LMG 8992]
MTPQDITQLLGITPRKSRHVDPSSRYRVRRENHYWDWESRAIEASRDGLAHIRAIIKILRNKEAVLDHLRASGCEIDICCYWVTSGQGGPFLDVETLADLGRLQLSIWWDIYYGDPNDYNEVSGNLSDSMSAAHQMHD